MRFFLASFSLAIALVALFMTAPLWMNSHELPPGNPQHKCDKHLTDRENDPRKIARPDESIKTIRLTNSGEFVDRCELTNALYEINWDREHPENSYWVQIKPNAVSKPKLVVLYVHGWKHNDKSSDRDRFEDLITRIRCSFGDRRHVVGVYVTWNADAGLGSILDNLSFWVKKHNADRIAQSSAVTLITSSIGAIVRSNAVHKDQFVAIGHSFGARMLFSATAQSTLTAVQQAHPGYPGGEYKIVRPFVDAVVLLNPAFEASRYSAINDFARNDEKFSPDQKPLMITVSTTGDTATGWFFPIGQWLGSARTNRELHTLGNYTPFRTHRLTETTREDCPANSVRPEQEARYLVGLCLQREFERRDENDDGKVKNLLPVQPHNPFIVAQTTPAVISDHNDIWNKRFTLWLEHLIRNLQE